MTFENCACGSIVILRKKKPKEKNQQLKNSLGLSEKKIVSYFGNFGLSQPVEQIIEVAKIIDDNSDVHFLIIGDGEKRERIKSLVKEYSLNNVTILNTVSRDELREYYSISDLMLVPLKNIPLFKTVIPSKIFESETNVIGIVN